MLVLVTLAWRWGQKIRKYDLKVIGHGLDVVVVYDVSKPRNALHLKFRRLPQRLRSFLLLVLFLYMPKSDRLVVHSHLPRLTHTHTTQSASSLLAQLLVNPSIQIHHDINPRDHNLRRNQHNHDPLQIFT